MSDIDTVPVDSLKALDPKRPIREADNPTALAFVGVTADIGRTQELFGDVFSTSSWSSLSGTKLTATVCPLMTQSGRQVRV